MPQYIDAYFLVPSRSPSVVHRFLDRFLPQREQSSENYLFPAADTNETDILFLDPFEAIAYMEAKPDESHAIYWRNTDLSNAIHHGMVFHTNDGMMILGVSIPGGDPEEDYAIAIFREIEAFTGAEWACMTVEEPPPGTEEEFHVFCKARFHPGEATDAPEHVVQHKEEYSRGYWWLFCYLFLELFFMILMIVEVYYQDLGMDLFGMHMVWFTPVSILVGLVTILSAAVSYDKGSMSKVACRRVVLVSIAVSLVPCLVYWLMLASGHC
ncbi:hypothetical protein [Chitinophaga agri]|uniref:Uncharacterized protein n=1 Tax=Chitinophaga agri TaxID=2703787 RepID=A0A6B9ZNA1_9BACT|nr:hypothetical protein [Chitinophaga agri]QHS63890.1 hypothetical protein GWR21_31215 [Chitinophaga agri]